MSESDHLTIQADDHLNDLCDAVRRGDYGPLLRRSSQGPVLRGYPQGHTLALAFRRRVLELIRDALVKLLRRAVTIQETPIEENRVLQALSEVCGAARVYFIVLADLGHEMLDDVGVQSTLNVWGEPLPEVTAFGAVMRVVPVAGLVAKKWPRGPHWLEADNKGHFPPQLAKADFSPETDFGKILAWLDDVVSLLETIIGGTDAALAEVKELETGAPWGLTPDAAAVVGADSPAFQAVVALSDENDERKTADRKLPAEWFKDKFGITPDALRMARNRGKIAGVEKRRGRLHYPLAATLKAFEYETTPDPVS